jgi:hypothetical protein
MKRQMRLCLSILTITDKSAQTGCPASRRFCEKWDGRYESHCSTSNPAELVIRGAGGVSIHIPPLLPNQEKRGAWRLACCRSFECD